MVCRVRGLGTVWLKWLLMAEGGSDDGVWHLPLPVTCRSAATFAVVAVCVNCHYTDQAP